MVEPLGYNQNSLKSKVLELVSNEKSLSAKQIYSRLKKMHSITSTYQAVHKTLKQMLEEGVLIKEKTVYSINPKWVEDFKKNADVLAEKVRTGKKEFDLRELSEGETVRLNFKGILEVGWFLVNGIMIAPNPKKTSGLALWRFCYSIVGLEEKHLTGLKKACKENKWHAFVEEDNKLDHLFGDTLLAYGFKSIKYRVKCATPLSDKMIIGDYIAEINYPSLFRKLWAIQNKLPVKIIEFNLAKHLLLMREIQPDIEVIITKNSKLAEEYRKEYFRK